MRMRLTAKRELNVYMRLADPPQGASERPPAEAPGVPGDSVPSQRRPVIAQYLQFALVGVSNAVVDLGVLNLLLALHPTRAVPLLLLDNTLAVALAILNSYLWNTRWTFRGGVTHQTMQRVLFVAQALLNIVINNVVLIAVTGVLPPSLSLSTLVLNNVAKIAAMFAASTTSFLLLRLVVFRPVTPVRQSIGR